MRETRNVQGTAEPVPPRDLGLTKPPQPHATFLYGRDRWSKSDSVGIH